MVNIPMVSSSNPTSTKLNLPPNLCGHTATAYNMARKKATISKEPSVSETSQKHRKNKQSQDSPATLEELHRIKEAGKQKYLQSGATQNAYQGYVRRGREWLEDLINHLQHKETINDTSSEENRKLLEENQKLLENPEFKDAFANIPNQLSAKVLALYLAYRGFDKEKPAGRSTVEGIHAAFKRLWTDASVCLHA